MTSKAMDSLEQNKGSLVIISSLLGKFVSAFSFTIILKTANTYTGL